MQIFSGNAATAMAALSTSKVSYVSTKMSGSELELIPPSSMGMDMVALWHDDLFFPRWLDLLELGQRLRPFLSPIGLQYRVRSLGYHEQPLKESKD